MNTEKRDKITAEALNNGVVNNPVEFNEYLVDSYVGKATVELDGVTYTVTGNKARINGAICTSGTLGIVRQSIHTKL